MPYGAGLRRQEFGIRMALGARPRAIAWMVVRHGILLMVIGAAIGLGLAAGVAPVLSIFLYGLTPIHPPTFAGAAVLFIALGVLASYLPARRAISIDAFRALRDE
jgi:putative ABC transport system permease protein